MSREINPSHAELPQRDLIDASTERDCEAQYQAVSGRMRAQKQARTDAQSQLEAALIERARQTQSRQARAVLYQAPRRRAQEALGRAVAHLTDAELDAAWRAALRGDSAVLEARVLPHLDGRSTRRKGSRTSTPWRASGWLRKR